jgi:hypothetical protein
MEGGIGPIHHPFDQSMLHRIKMGVIHVRLIFLVISDLMLPEPPLPNGGQFIYDPQIETA